MKKLFFEKNYVRDTTILVQQIWARALSSGIAEAKDWKNPHLPIVIHYMRNGVVEIWDNAAACDWLKAKLLEENTTQPKYILESLEEYKKQLLQLKRYWEVGFARSIEEFDEYLKLLPKLLLHFNLWYYTVTNDATPQYLKDMILAIRKDDVFFATNDIYVSKTLKKLYPDISGYESLILLEEIYSVPSLATLQKRSEGAALIDGVELFIGKPDVFAEAYPAYILKNNEAGKNISSVKGQAAFKGVVRGKVRMLYRRDQVQSVQLGDVIVSPMTTPDFLPAMQNAVAFVTDEGGITCHAAIVAREMKKPCVIGTKIATQVFKDGDMVEVDANTGIVTIIT